MSARPYGLSVLTALSVAVPGALAAQAGRACEVVIDRTGGVGRQVDIGGGLYHIYQSGGVWAHCRGQDTRMYADSVAYYQERGRLDMTGNVEFQDSTAELTAARASYFLADERLEAYQNAVLRNRETGSRMTGPNLTYRRKAPGIRDTTELTADRRPTIAYLAPEDTAGAEPYVIVGDRVRMRGNTRTWIAGAVTIDRSDFHAKADSAQLDTDTGHGRLVGHARVEGGEDAGFALSGRAVSFRLDEGQLSWVQAEQLAEAVSSEWRVVADTLQFDIAADRIQEGSAWGDSTPPRAVSRASTIAGDSLHIVAPDQRLERVRAIGAGRATARRDSLDQESDWVAGDTVIAVFAPDTADARVIERLEALGDARTRYRIYEEDGRTLAGINYSRGTRILARFRSEELDVVHVWGQTDGVYLEAARP